MRGKTAKKIRKFVKNLIDQTPEEQRNKSYSQMVNEVKTFWYKSPNAKKFINHTLNGKDQTFALT